MIQDNFSKQKALKLIRNKNYVSFDIFDTLILRPYLKPSDLFIQIEKDLKLRGFAKDRIKAEEQARVEASMNEVTYNQIYKNLKDKYEGAYEYELELEKRVCQRNPEIYELYKYAIENRKKIIFTSDMYLPKVVIEEILKKTGYNIYDNTFLSSQYNATKYTGKLFQKLLEKMSIRAKDLLHIGDNEISDVRVPSKMGIQNIYYPKVIDRFLDLYYNLSVLVEQETDGSFKKDELSLSLILGINSILWIENKEKDYWRKFGHIYAAPLLYSFTNWIYETAKKKGIKNLAFVARDGYSLIRIFNLIDNKKEFNANYIYLPRYVALTSNLKNKEDIPLIFNKLGMSKENIELLIKDFASENINLMKNFTNFKKTHSKANTEDLIEFVTKNKSFFYQESYNRRAVLFAYLDSLGLFDEDFFIIDSTSLYVSSLRVIETILKERKLNAKISGCYYIIINRFKGLNLLSMAPNNMKYFTYNWNLLEYFMSSPEMPILSIREDNDGYRPVYQDISENQLEQFRIETYNHVIKGIMDFSEKTYKIFGRKIFDLDTLILYINNLIRNPSTLDIAEIKKLHHSYYHDNNYHKLIDVKGIKDENLRDVFNLKTTLKRISPELEHYFFGYFDIQSMDKKGKNHLALNVSFMDRLPTKYDPANICLINEDGTVAKIEKTYSWNFLQGALSQYLPNDDNKIIYNIFDKRDKAYKSVIYDLKAKKKKILPMPIANISPKGDKALSINFSRLYNYRSGYGYSNIMDHYFHDKAPKNDGVFLMDLQTGENNFIISYKKLWQDFMEGTDVNNKKIIISHIKFNTDGNKFVMLLRWFSKEAPNQGLTLVSDIEGKNIKDVFGFGSHCHWKDENTILISGFERTYKDNMRQVTLYEIDTNTGIKRLVDPEFFTEDGHCSYSPNRKYILYDSYASIMFPYRKLQVYDIEMKRGINVGFFYSDPKLYNEYYDCRCDLHPRWSPDGSKISFDSIHEGYRGIYQVNTKEVIYSLNENQKDFITADEIRLIVKGSLHDRLINTKWYKFSIYSKKILVNTRYILKNIQSNLYWPFNHIKKIIKKLFFI